MIRQTPLYFIYGYLVSLGMVVIGAMWCFTPARFAALYQKAVPFARTARPSDLQRLIRSTAGRACGAFIALLGIWIVLLLSAQVIRLRLHLTEPGAEHPVTRTGTTGAPRSARKPVVT